jgi:hypothetical protein
MLLDTATPTQRPLRRRVAREPATLLRVLDADPELGAGLTAAEAREARQRALAPVSPIVQGRCDWRFRPDHRPPFGLLVLSGVLTRHVEVGSSSCRELVGPGDVLRPWVDCEVYGPVPSGEWRALVPGAVAILDGRFTRAVCAWPAIATELMNRLLSRTRWLEVQFAICQHKKVEERLEMILWQFAYRWGKVVPGGVALRVPLTHRLLAEIVGAERPTVTTALGRLRDLGLVEQMKTDTPGWLLKGEAPFDLQAGTEDGPAQR